MTTYFGRVLGEFARRFDYRFSMIEHGGDPGNADLLISHDGSIPDSVNGFRGTHIIRDPRDLIVSGYYYHLRTTESWCVNPNPHNTDIDPDVSYQEHLRSLPTEEGLHYEMHHVSGGEIQKMLAWDYSSDDFLELRFEGILGNEAGAFDRIFQWYGFSPDECAAASRLAARYAANRKRRYLDYLRRNRPITRGSKLGQWRGVFTPALKDDFKQSFGDALVRLGYETSNDW